MVKSANSDFLRNDKDRTPVDKPSLPDLPQDNTAALKKASEARRRLAEEAAQAEADVEEQSAKDTAEAWGFYNEIIVRDSKEKTDALKQQWQQVFDAIDQEQTDAINEGQAFIEAQAATIKQTASSTAQDIALVFSSAAGEAINNWQGFGNLLKGIFKDLNQIVLKALVIKPLEDSIGSALKGFSLASLFGAANGAAFGGSGVIPFASGGVVNSPTLFRFAKGTGLMGEAGPEAILPLARGRNGKLGVQGGGSALTYSPVIQIDSRTDQAQVAQLVGGMLAADKQQLLAYLKAHGAMA